MAFLSQFGVQINEVRCVERIRSSHGGEIDNVMECKQCSFTQWFLRKSDESFSFQSIFTMNPHVKEKAELVLITGNIVSYMW